MIVARNVWEYDVEKAGKTFLESLGYKLSDEKERYVVEIGNTFKQNKDLYDTFINEMKDVLLSNIPPNVQILRYYVDEVVTDAKLNITSTKYKIRERKILLYIDEGHNRFVKIYEDLSYKISKNFTLQAKDFYQDIAKYIRLPINEIEFLKRVSMLMERFINQKYDISNYIIVRNGQKWIISTDFEVIYQDGLNVEIDKRFYYNLATKYLRGLIS